MAKVIIAGNAVVITSNIKLADIALIGKYQPEALVLFEGEGDEKEPVFAIGIGGCGISNFGAEFDQEAHDGSGNAQLTEFIPSEIEDVKAYVGDKFGRAILKLNKLEAQLPEVINAIAAEKAMIDANIEVVQ